MLSQSLAQAVDRGWAYDQEKEAPQDFQDAVQALEDDSDDKGLIEEISAPEPVHVRIISAARSE